jgi:hypothetical protein
MNIKVHLIVEDPDFVDEEDRSGLTEAAHNALTDLLNDDGYTVIDILAVP